MFPHVNVFVLSLEMKNKSHMAPNIWFLFDDASVKRNLSVYPFIVFSIKIDFVGTILHVF